MQGKVGQDRVALIVLVAVACAFVCGCVVLWLHGLCPSLCLVGGWARPFASIWVDGCGAALGNKVMRFVLLCGYLFLAAWI